jgi:hypothetical protein
MELLGELSQRIRKTRFDESSTVNETKALLKHFSMMRYRG